MNHPLRHLQDLWSKAKQSGVLPHRNVICVSTIDDQGFPHSRFVDLKEINQEGLIFCTDLKSNKAKEILNNPKVSLTIWWEHVAHQIRIQGFCSLIDTQLADSYWEKRVHDAQVVSYIFDQSQEIKSLEAMQQKFLDEKSKYDRHNLIHPETWGGFIIKPIQIEFLEFKETRLHLRTQYSLNSTDQLWVKTFLQP
ncbi:pyridoxine/pyridoxamine 5'-phosphate oxidase [Acinetobacter bereziniae]|uniref:pyridoxine/pyridoxamine 5'-phosphate oxidase n=1 Tax=Acinetobacter bereziniae TaxID=106648 RepID=UPI001D1813BA|nr:pyridoxal 5'-phosphate synthase [Acinetobacter bereziniae]